MLKNLHQLELTINEKTHRYQTDSNTALVDIKEALFQFQRYIGHVEDQIKIQTEALKVQQEAEQSKIEPIEAPKE